MPCGGAIYGDDNLVFVANDWHTALLPVYLQVRLSHELTASLAPALGDISIAATTGSRQTGLYFCLRKVHAVLLPARGSCWSQAGH